MTSGIYKLSFRGTDKVYIGQSKNIEQRLKQHISLFRASLSSKKMTEAYKLFGTPTISILIEAEKDLLDSLEAQFINQYNSIDNGWNTRSNITNGGSLWGDMHGMSIYSNEQIIDCLFLLIQVPRLTYPQISSKTGVLKSTIVDIANGTGHLWLSKYFATEYALLMSFRHKSNTRLYKKAVSPEGVVYTVEHLSNFCKLHKLDTGNMSRLLRGKRKSYVGWTALPQEI